jgi:hypothetical protein
VHMKTSGSHSTLKAEKSVMIKVWIDYVFL